MARDENDRSYEDGQGRPSNPDLTGDVLSPRWSTDDTDEQPAIQVSGNETYILPPAPSVPADGVTTGEPIYLDDQGAYVDGEYLTDGRIDALYTGDSPSGAHYTGDSPSGPVYTGDSPSGAHRLDEDRAEVTYLPLDKSYESSYGDDEESPKRGFLGSGWTENSDHGHGRSDREVRRRTRLLVVAATAVVLLGGGAGWMLTSTSSDDPCAGGRCATVGELNQPAATPNDDLDVPVEDAEDTAAPEPTASKTRTPTQTAEPVRTRPTRTAAAEPRATPTRRSPSQTARPTGRATQAPDDERVENDTPDIKPTARKSKTEESIADKPADQPTMAPPTDNGFQPAPQETQKGLLDILFPWA